MEIKIPRKLKLIPTTIRLRAINGEAYHATSIKRKFYVDFFGVVLIIS